MRTFARGAALALLTGTLLVAVGNPASAGEGRGTGKGSTNSANSGCGEYCSTRDGSPSRNGNGSSSHRPCAGCVGKADDKNPRGQRPNGSDSNNGYECDGNNGIAKGNPAHTGCTPAVAPAPAAPAPAAPGTDVAGNDSEAPAAPAEGVAPVVPASPAAPAQAVAGRNEKAAEAAGSDTVGTQVLGTRFVRPNAAAPGALPFTGGMTVELTLAAGALIVTGLAATRLGARTR